MARELTPYPFERNEIASALFEHLRQCGGQWVAVRVQDPAHWEVVKPRSQEAILAACETLASDALVGRVAKAIYDATDPNSGDSIATTIHMTEHIPPEGTIAEQLEQVMETCRAAARAAIAAIQGDTK